MCKRRDKKARVILVKFKDGKRTIWKAFDCNEFQVAKGLTKDECKRICIRKGYEVR